MRKGQEKILKKAEDYHLSQEKKNFLMREDLSIKELNFAIDFLRAYETIDYIILEQLIRDKQCQKYKYAFSSAIYSNMLPKIEDLYNIFQNKDIPNNEQGIALSMLSNGWSYTDCCEFLKEYQEAIKKTSEYKINDETEYTYLNFYKILKASNNKTGNLSLWKKYAVLALSDARIFLSDVWFAIEHNIQPEEFKQYEYEPNQYLKQHLIPHLNILSEEFINTNTMQLSRCHVNNLEELQKVISILNNKKGVTFHDNDVYKNYISIAEKAINIHLEHFSSAYYNYNKYTPYWYGANKQHDINLIIFYDGGIYYKLQNEKLVPLSIKKLLSIKYTYGLYGETVFQFIMKYCIEKLNAPVLKDIYRLIEETDMFLPPVTFNECKNIHNFNELFQKKWKESYHINWNRTNINLGYMIIKALPLVQKKDRNKLLAIKNVDLLNDLNGKYNFKWNRRIGNSFIAQIIVSHIPEIKEDEKEKYLSLLNDYMKMSHVLHQSFKISFRSKKKIVDAHDKVMLAYNEKMNIHKIKIPKRSRFNQLRKILPSSFEWIKDGKRLYYEGIKMQHCVNSYYDYINQDICAIYSVVYKEKRYTIEFRQHKNKMYYFTQIQSKCDRGCPEEVKEWINSFLEKK